MGLFSLLATAPASAPAQTVGDDGLEVVTIVARIARPLAATDASVTVIDAPQIEERLAENFRDLVRYEPGISVRGDATRFGDDSIAIRGIGGNRVRVEIDGVPRPSAFAVGSFANAGRALADLDFVRRIEILKGPASATYGSAAIGGVIAVETLEPVDLLDDARPFGARGRLQYGSDDHGLSGSAVVAGRGAALDWLGGFRQRTAGEVQNQWVQLDANPRDSRGSSWLAKAALTSMASPLRLTVTGSDRRAQTEVDSLRLQPGRFANTTALRGDDRAGERSFVLDQRLRDIGILSQLEWRVFHQHIDVEQLTFEERRAAPPRAPALRIDRSFRYDASVTGAKFVGAVDATTSSWTHGLSFGGELSRQDIAELRDGVQTSFPSLATTRTILGEAFPLRDFPNSRVVEAGVFVFDEMRRGDSLWSFSPALRIDHYRLTPAPDAIYLEDNSAQTPVGVRETSVSARLGAAYRFGEGYTAFGQYTHGFRSPPFEDVNIGLDLPQFLTRAIPNPDLRPETSDHFEIGLRASRPRVSGTGSGYLARYRDFIESRVNLGRDPLSGYTVFQAQNRARARIWGAEVAMRARLGSDLGSPGGWAASVAAAFSRGDDTVTGRPLNGVDPPRAVVGVDYSPAGLDWRVEGVLTVAEGQSRVDESTGPLARAGGYSTLDVLGGWKINERVHLRAAFFNVFDRRYAEWADIRGRAESDPTLDLYTRPGRSVSLGLTLQLD